MSATKDKATLRKAIKLCMKYGYSPDGGAAFLGIVDGLFSLADPETSELLLRGLLLEPAFSHALWGDGWKKNLQSMAIAPDYIQYLRDNM